MLVIELVSKWEICWALWSLVLFDPVWRPNLIQKMLRGFLIGDLLRLSPLWNRLLKLGFYGSVVAVFDMWEKRLLPQFCTLYFSLIIVKSLQLHGRRQIAEPHKYCLVHVIVFFGVCFLYFLFLTGWEFELIPYKDKIWYRHI